MRNKVAMEKERQQKERDMKYERERQQWAEEQRIKEENGPWARKIRQEKQFWADLPERAKRYDPNLPEGKQKTFWKDYGGIIGGCDFRYLKDKLIGDETISTDEREVIELDGTSKGQMGNFLQLMKKGVTGRKWTMEEMLTRVADALIYSGDHHVLDSL